ncbi:MAG: 2-polyprenyl-3-methyl-6-methoxy-1,4-benzoquinone monooxygenase [Legionellaceae bacterium]|nr:2-polyprenyl-3-methyl-6-methoxy-1,4-benzoquinone monooxygenase [Legionellaceae bacterium]
MSATALEQLISVFDTSLRTLFPPEERVANRPYPAEHIKQPSLGQAEKKQVAGLMRVNHAGEVCAQALYQGQALTAKLSETRQKMEQAAAEEVDHLSWCEQRLRELDSHPSLLNPLWYLGSFIIGAAAGLAGDRYSLGFVAETERQVAAHLHDHLTRLPQADMRSRAIVKQMHADECQHAEQAHNAGAAVLPKPVQDLMRWVSKAMTRSSYYI